MLRAALTCLALVVAAPASAAAEGVSPAAASPEEEAAPEAAPAVGSDAVRDPRNWPTVTRLVADRYEVAGRVVTLRVHARPSEYYGCGYRHERDRLMAFTLMGGPLETLTGYLPADLGRVLARQLARDPWLPVTVQVRFDPEKLSELCPDQVEVLKWSRGWQYPPGTLSPGRPDPTLQPTRAALDAADQGDLWRALSGRKVRRRGDGPQPPTEEELLGTMVELTAGARLANAFHCAFRGAARTHWSLRLHDGRGHFVHAYVRRSPEAARLVDMLALHRDVLVEVQGRVTKQVPSTYCMPQLEITGWTFPDAGATAAR